MAVDQADLEQLFRSLESPETRPHFWERVAEDVDWVVAGTHPLAGRYGDRDDFIVATFERLGRIFDGPARLELLHVSGGGDTAVAELRVTARTIGGETYENILCWVCRFEDDRIVGVRAYLDSAMVTWTLLRNEPLLD